MNSDNEFDDLDLDKLPGIFDDNFKNNKNQYLNEEIIPSFPELPKESNYQNQTKKIINEEINANKISQKEEEIFTFKNINNNKGRIINKNENKYNTELNNKINDNNNKKRIENDKINANILSFEELMKKNKERNMNKSKDKSDNRKIMKIDFSRKLYKNKKTYENEKENKEIKINKLTKNKSNKILKDLPHNKSEISIKSKKIFKQNKIPNKKNPNNKENKILYNYFKLDNSSKKKSNIILNYKDKNIILNFENLNEHNNNNKSFITDNNTSRDTSLIMNKSSRTIKPKNNKKKKVNMMNEIEEKIKLALKKEGNKSITKRHSDIKNDVINFDKTKFEKYDTEQIRYDLIKDYSFIHAEKDNDFLERMQFDFLKRKNKEKKLNEYVEKNKNKYKINENKRKKTFNRLIEDANRRIIMKQEIMENEKYLTDYRDILDNSKKYNQEEWDKIYKKRFKEYEDIKKKKMDIQRQNEKIKKMLKEEEEINMCPIKKIPLSRIKQSSERLFNDAKRREYLRNNNKNLINDKSVKSFKPYKNKVCLTNFNDEEDASKYMKNYKGVEYNFLNDKQKDFNRDKNNNYFSQYNNNENSNKSFDKRNLKKNNKMSVTEFNNLRFNTNNDEISNYLKKKAKNMNNYNLNFNNNIIQPYFNFKKNKKKIGLNNNYIPTPTMPCEYNYNNYNIYNINNLNNNINSNFRENLNNEFSNDDDYLTNITNQLIQSAALNKIDNTNNNKYQQNIFSNVISKINDNKFDNQETEGNQIIEQFLSSKFEN